MATVNHYVFDLFNFDLKDNYLNDFLNTSVRSKASRRASVSLRRTQSCTVPRHLAVPQCLLVNVPTSGLLVPHWEAETILWHLEHVCLRILCAAPLASVRFENFRRNSRPRF